MTKLLASSDWAPMLDQWIQPRR